MSTSNRIARQLALMLTLSLVTAGTAGRASAQSRGGQPARGGQPPRGGQQPPIESEATRPESTYDQITDAMPLQAEQGVVEVVRERYANGNVKIQREVTLDASSNYVNHGAWKMWDPAGKLITEGQFHMGKRVGNWTRWHSRRDSEALSQFPFNRFREPFGSQVNFTDGVMDGDWVIVDGEHKRCQLISLKMGKRHGPAITWLPNGKEYNQWTFEEGVPVGEVLQANEHGELQQSQIYENGRRVVTKTSHYNSSKRQKKIEEMYLAATTVQATPDDYWNLKFATYKSEGEDLRHGPSRSWYANGARQHEGRFEHDKKVGRFTHWYPNGQVALVAEYRDDQPHGNWVWWHENGLKKVFGSYDAGKPIGEWRWWNSEGRLTRHETPNEDELQVKQEDAGSEGWAAPSDQRYDAANEKKAADQPVETATAEPLLLPTPAEENDPLDFLR